MTKPISRPWWLQTLRVGLMLAAAGLCFAITLYAISQAIGFPALGVFFWPTAVFMMALSGMEGGEFALWTLAIIASNAVLYFVVGIVFTPPILLARKLLLKSSARQLK